MILPNRSQTALKNYGFPGSSDTDLREEVVNKAQHANPSLNADERTICSFENLEERNEKDTV
jgi:hypothetical protein